MKVFVNIRKTMVLRRFFSLEIGITIVHCIAMVSVRSVEQQHSNSHFFSIPFPFFWYFSLRSLPTLPFSECVFFWHFSLRSLPTLPFSEFPFFWLLKFFLYEAYRFRKTSQTSDAQKNTPLIFINQFEENSMQLADTCTFK